MKLYTLEMSDANIRRIVFQRRQLGFWATFEMKTVTPTNDHKETIRPYISELRGAHKALTRGEHNDTIDGGRAIEWWQNTIFCQPLASTGETGLVSLNCNTLAVVEHMLCHLNYPIYTEFVLEGPELEATTQAVTFAFAQVEERNRIY